MLLALGWNGGLHANVGCAFTPVYSLESTASSSQSAVSARSKGTLNNPTCACASQSHSTYVLTDVLVRVHRSSEHIALSYQQLVGRRKLAFQTYTTPTSTNFQPFLSFDPLPSFFLLLHPRLSLSLLFSPPPLISTSIDLYRPPSTSIHLH